MHESIRFSRVRKANPVKIRLVKVSIFHFFSVDTPVDKRGFALHQQHGCIPSSPCCCSLGDHDPYSFYLCYLCCARSICSGNCIDGCSFGARTRLFVDNSGSLRESIWEPVRAGRGLLRYRNRIYLRTFVSAREGCHLSLWLQSQ
jgi:hypothetical protein